MDTVPAKDFGACVLGVEKSVTGKRWVSPMAGQDVDRLAQALSQRHDLTDLVGRVLAGRGIGLDEAATFLKPALRSSLPDPSLLKDMEPGAARLADAIERGGRIGILADYDVDGATSAALLTRYVHSLGGSVAVHVPDRMTEGYGPNIAALRSLAAKGCDVVVTLDCGVLAHAVLDEAAADGIDVVVIDHHMAEPALPRAVAVINPNRLDEDGSLGHLAAVGVTFLTLVGITRTLRSRGYFNDRQEPNPLQWLDLVALGTVCDVVPLHGLNRAYVAQGLKVMARRGNAGLAALSDVAGVDASPDAYHLGFVFGPRVNAGGRVGDSGIGARLLATDDAEEARALAAALDRCNGDRKEIEADVTRAAIADIERRYGTAEELPPVMVAAGEGWHPGVIGIVAGRLKEKYGLPACVIALDGSEGKGSGRSVRGVDLGAAVIAAHQAGILRRGGGHAMAAGFTVARDCLESFEAFLIERFNLPGVSDGLAPTLIGRQRFGAGCRISGPSRRVEPCRSFWRCKC